MMKVIVKALFHAYHYLWPSSMVSCRYSPTCSQYLLDATEKHGLPKGLLLTLVRVISCNPFSHKPYFDPA